MTAVPSYRTLWPQAVYKKAWKCYSSLSTQDRQILLMSYVDALSGPEIACVLEMDEAEVIGRLIAARQRLRGVLRRAMALAVAPAGSGPLPPSTAA